MQPRSISNDAGLMVTAVAVAAMRIGHRYCRLQGLGPSAVEEQLDLEPGPERLHGGAQCGMFSSEIHEVNGRLIGQSSAVVDELQGNLEIGTLEQGDDLL